LSKLIINEIIKLKNNQNKITFNLIVGDAIMNGYIIIDKEDVGIITQYERPLDDYILGHIQMFI